MRIGELSKRSGFSRDTIRLYERSGLIGSQSREANNNYKDYPDSALITLEVVRDAQSAGISISDLSLLLRQLECADPLDFDGDAFLAKKIEEVQSRIEAATRFLEMLLQARDGFEAAALGEE